MASGDSIRGTRVGSGPIRWDDSATEGGDAVPRRVVGYWCANGHQTAPSFAIDVPLPHTWDCPRCGLPAGRDQHNPPPPPRVEPYKSHLAYVKERRSDADAAAILAEAIARRRASRGEH